MFVYFHKGCFFLKLNIFLLNFFLNISCDLFLILRLVLHLVSELYFVSIYLLKFYLFFKIQLQCP